WPPKDNDIDLSALIRVHPRPMILFLGRGLTPMSTDTAAFAGKRVLPRPLSLFRGHRRCLFWFSQHVRRATSFSGGRRQESRMASAQHTPTSTHALGDLP